MKDRKSDQEVDRLEDDLNPADLATEEAVAAARAERVNRWLNANQSYVSPRSERDAPEGERPARRR